MKKRSNWDPIRDHLKDDPARGIKYNKSQQDMNNNDNIGLYTKTTISVIPTKKFLAFLGKSKSSHFFFLTFIQPVHLFLYFLLFIQHKFELATYRGYSGKAPGGVVFIHLFQLSLAKMKTPPPGAFRGFLSFG